MDIREVARRSGVSVATVSRALNGRRDVSAATRLRVAEVAAALGYEPNQTARTLVRRRSDTVGLIWDTGYVGLGRRQPFLQDLLVGFKVALARVGYHLLLLSTTELDSRAPRDSPTRKDSPTHKDSFVRAVRQHNLEGVVLMGVDADHPGVAALVEREVPCVGFDQPLHGPRASYVTSDNHGGAVLAVEHLHALGHRRIATVTGPLSLLPARERLAGYTDARRRLGLPDEPAYVVHGDFFLASGSAGLSALLDLPEPPTAVFVAGDEMAFGGLQALLARGRDAPDDLSVVGFDDLESAAHVRPALTTIAQDHLALGQAAVAELQRLIDGAPASAEQPVRLPTRLVVRASTAALS